MSQGSAAALSLPDHGGRNHEFDPPPQHQSPHHSGQRPEPHRRAPVRSAKRNAHTVANAGHLVRISPAALWLAAAAFLIMMGWSVATVAYFAFHDDVLKGLMGRLRAQQYAYEDRIAELRTQIDRTTSRQLLSQEQFQQKLDELLRRQTALESRAQALGGLADPGTTGSVRPATRSLEPAPQRLDSGKQSSTEDKLLRLEVSLDRMESHQTAVVTQIQTRYEAKTRQIRAVLDGLGLKFNAIPAATGGPFVPVKLPPASESFAHALTQASISRARAEELSNTLTFVPLRKPLTSELDMTSPFGVRIDPFVREASMHTGMDFRGNVGDPIHATGTGKVVKAGWEGGYGQMVEIDHGEGLSSRYGHLSEIDVSVGQSVRVGQVIGHMGSTGRSTGPHLHYETRINGEAVNPEKFLSAGAALFGEHPIVRSTRSNAQD
jgi:murein DD-endopeptidase MepM/ murein hydrolase activator NlpD